MAKKKAVTDPNEERLRRIRARWDLINRSWQDQREKVLANLAFLAPDGQWDPREREDREGRGLPCIQEDRLTPIIHQIVNEQRQNRPAIKIAPINDGADEDTAKVLQGMIRHIENVSNAAYAYDTAFESGVRCGMGFWRIGTQYVDPFSFQQEITVTRVLNPLSVYFDPACVQPDFSDAQDCFVVSDMTIEDFKEEYPESKAAQENDGRDWASLGNQLPDWFGTDEAGKGTVRVAEYFYRDRQPITVCLLEDGTTVEKSEVPEGAEIRQERKSVKIVIRWMLLTGTEILDERDLDGKFIPIIPFLGDELIVDTKRIYSGIVDRAADPQRVFNYMKSTQVLTIALAPKAPWVGPKGFMGTGARRKAWENANANNITALEYDVISVDGKPMPAPHRDTAEPNIQAVTVALAGSIDGIKATTGVFDASLGAKEANQSGRAIISLQHQSNTGNFHFSDNMSRAIAFSGRVILDLLPHVYDVPQMVRILGEDGKQEAVQVNAPSGKFDEQGAEKVFDLSVGRYDVVVETGPSFATKRAENVAVLSDLVSKVPAIGQAGPDILVSQMDFPAADELAARLRKMVPPQVLESDNKAPQIPPQVAQQLQALSQQHEQLVQAVHAAHDELDKRTQDNAVKLQIAAMDNETRLEIARLQAVQKADTAHLQAEMAHTDAVARRLEALADRALQPTPSQDPSQDPAGDPASVGTPAPAEVPTPMTQAPDASEEAV